jgi:hypothetical protein
LTRVESGYISFLDVLSAVPPFPSHAREAKSVERRDRSQSNWLLVDTCFEVVFKITLICSKFYLLYNIYSTYFPGTEKVDKDCCNQSPSSCHSS